MRKVILALTAAVVVSAGTIVAPTKSEAHPAALVVAGVVAVTVIGTIIVLDALARPAHAEVAPEAMYPRRHRHHRRMHRAM